MHFNLVWKQNGCLCYCSGQVRQHGAKLRNDIMMRGTMHRYKAAAEGDSGTVVSPKQAAAARFPIHIQIWGNPPQRTQDVLQVEVSKLPVDVGVLRVLYYYARMYGQLKAHNIQLQGKLAQSKLEFCWLKEQHFHLKGQHSQMTLDLCLQPKWKCVQLRHQLSLAILQLDKKTCSTSPELSHLALAQLIEIFERIVCTSICGAPKKLHEIPLDAAVLQKWVTRFARSSCLKEGEAELLRLVDVIWQIRSSRNRLAHPHRALLRRTYIQCGESWKKKYFSNGKTDLRLWGILTSVIDEYLH